MTEVRNGNNLVVYNELNLDIKQRQSYNQERDIKILNEYYPKTREELTYMTAVSCIVFE